MSWGKHLWWGLRKGFTKTLLAVVFCLHVSCWSVFFILSITFQVRSIQCLARVKNVTSPVDGALCDDAGLEAPVTYQRCGFTECPQWHFGEWSECESSRCFTLHYGELSGGCLEWSLYFFLFCLLQLKITILNLNTFFASLPSLYQPWYYFSSLPQFSLPASRGGLSAAQRHHSQQPTVWQPDTSSAPPGVLQLPVFRSVACWGLVRGE